LARHKQELKQWEHHKQLAASLAEAGGSKSPRKAKGRKGKSREGDEMEVDSTTGDLPLGEEDAQFLQDLPDPDVALPPNFDVQVGVLLNKVCGEERFWGNKTLLKTFFLLRLTVSLNLLDIWN